MDNDLAIKLQELKKGYLLKLKEIFSKLNDMLNAEEIHIEELYSRVHKLAGTSGMYGFKEISEISTDFEFYLKDLKSNEASINKEELKNKFSDYIKNAESFLAKE